ncbi:MAG TPA: tetratricopeptide repeat protein, partial [Polyangiaceae bacterium]
GTGIELDLPSVGDGRAGPGAPARGRADLPTVSKSQPALPAASGVGLPARAAVPRAGERPLGPAPGRVHDIELPSPRGELPDLGGVDLPLVGGDLPSAMEFELPSPSGGLPSLAADLPMAGIDLPTVGGNLPARGGSSGYLPELGGSLPSLGGSLPSPGAGLPSAAGSLPARASASPSLPPALGGSFPSSSSAQLPAQGLGMQVPLFDDDSASKPALAEIDLPPSESLPPPQPFGGGGGFGAGGAFGEVDLMGGLGKGPDGALPGASSEADPLEADPFGEAPMPGPLASPAAPAPSRFGQAQAAASAAALQRQTGGGGTDYGEVSLDSGDSGDSGAEMALDGPSAGQGAAAGARGDEDMEFGAVPQEPAPGSSSQVHMQVPIGTLAAEKTKRRLGLKVLVGVFVVGLGGAALALVPSVGPFGAFFVMDRLNAPEYHAQVLASAKSADVALALDTYPDVARALRSVTDAQSRARRAKGLAALAAYVGFTSELRFGTDSATHARASVLLDELAEETNADMLDLARAARAAADGEIARARQLLGTGEAGGKSAESTFLRAELELRAKDAKAALVAWEAAKAYGDTPRVHFGLARAKLAAGDEAGAQQEAAAVLAKSPGHVGARVLLARLSAGSRENEARAITLLEAVIKDAGAASADELVSSYTLLGIVHLGRSRITAAEGAFSEALKINPKAARALVGLGDSLYRAGRYSEAQARFEAGAQADPDDIVASIGVAKSKLALERVQEASAILKKLREVQPAHPLVGYWFGRVQESLGARDVALSAYKDVLKAAPSDPASADVYIALALLQNQQGQPEQAQKTLDSAKQLMPNVAGVWSALGDVALSQGRYKEALVDFQRASELDPEDLGAKFRIASALRRDGQLEQASVAFDQVSAIDKDYPGLALERGLLFEASGKSEEALKQYEDALAKAPTDPDLMLRVGCGKVAAGRADQAEELLRKVLSQRPSSAETHHCLGRVLLVQGTRLADALRMLERAVELDANRAEYYLYVGWAANEAGNVPKAEKALAEALRLDQGLADAFWQRGVLRQRPGAVRDAISDLTRALSLRPSRSEAHAALADAFYDFGREAEAMREWHLAIQAQPDNATWRFRYGKLLAANRQNEAAIEQLGKALELVIDANPPPRWRWEAYHSLARALGPAPEAVRNWEQFLRLGPRDSPYRVEAKAYLEKAGKPWTGD